MNKVKLEAKKKNTSLDGSSQQLISHGDASLFIEKKLLLFQDVLQRTYIHLHRNKKLDILGLNDMTNCVKIINDITKSINETINKIGNSSSEIIISDLQQINNQISILFKMCGTQNFEDVLSVCFGNHFNVEDSITQEKFLLIKKYFHPIGYKLMSVKKDSVESTYINLDCLDYVMDAKDYHMKVYGIKVYIYNETIHKHLMVHGYIDDILIDDFKNKYIINKLEGILKNKPLDQEFQKKAFVNFIGSLTLKDFLSYSSTIDFYGKYSGMMHKFGVFKKKTLFQMIKEFMAVDLYQKRMIIIQLLINNEQIDNQYLAYLLYDLLSNDGNGNIDTAEQICIFDSFPSSIKSHFRDAMKKTIQYTSDLTNFDMNKIPLEQQICLMNACESVKEKAMLKLKEIKAKSEDSGSKARQYLDGLLKIPFNVYKKEPILYVMNDTKVKFKELSLTPDFKKCFPEVEIKNEYSSMEIVKYVNTFLANNQTQTVDNSEFNFVKNKISKYNKTELYNFTENINKILMKQDSDTKLIPVSKTKSKLIKSVNEFIEICSNSYPEVLKTICDMVIGKETKNQTAMFKEIVNINNTLSSVKNYITDVKKTLDSAVYGHDKAKQQIERIIGQWINGDLDGYCFGFEGPPGVGKTSLAKKGLSDCLKDENNISRPFSMIQMGGDSNGSTITGHNYTYVGSTWGSIVEILIDKKCMNPIIFIDEIDKISKTEHGKEIIGILTHLLDPAQNDCFQDKYFSGINLDLSKALFILSYNDAELIDKILLDRVHRIKFNSLSIEDKLVISKKHILPEVYKKMGLENMINIDDTVLKYIIEEYTSESGVRKLKELLFEIIGEVNIEVLKNISPQYDIPFVFTIEKVRDVYLKDRQRVKEKKIHSEPSVGIINGLWANSLGKGGIIPIQVNYFPACNFYDLKLTGMQGDVMKESMNVALTLSWNITPVERQLAIREKYDTSENHMGVHIHCPEGSTPKDGPSAGTAITTTIYSLLNERKIKNTIAITGEITLDGSVTEIGGLDLKILGGIKAGVKEFIYPTENQKDFDKFMDKYKNTALVQDIQFYRVSSIKEVFELVFTDK